MKYKIAKFGFEIEGEFSNRLLNFLNDYGEVKTDASVHRCRKCSHLVTMEFASKALSLNSYGRKMLKEIFGELETAKKNKEFHWNKSAGFHVHVSFSPRQKPPEIFSVEFTELFRKKMKEKYPKVYARRSFNSYCRAREYNEEEVMHGDDRYRFINLRPAMNTHGTIEFRIFPAGTPKNMRQYLLFVLKFVKEVLRDGVSSKKEIELNDEDIEQVFELNDTNASFTRREKEYSF